MLPVGQIVPTCTSQRLSEEDLGKIKAKFKIINCCDHFSIYIASQNANKIKAAQNGIKAWAKKHFAADPEISTVACESQSGVESQPIGERTDLGARNRLNFIHENYKKHVSENALTVFIAFENGIQEETLIKVINPEIYQTSEKKAWVDRCVIHCTIYCGTVLMAKVHGLSDGVTVPKDCVEESKKSLYTKTAGSFIAERYLKHISSANDNWHEYVGGVSRQQLMTEALIRAL